MQFIAVGYKVERCLFNDVIVGSIFGGVNILCP